MSAVSNVVESVTSVKLVFWTVTADITVMRSKEISLVVIPANRLCRNREKLSFREARGDEESCNVLILRESRFLTEPVLSEKERFLASLGMTKSEGVEMTTKT